MATEKQLPLDKQFDVVRRATREINRTLSKLARQVRRLEREHAAAVKAAPPRRTLKLSPARRAALKLQGTYMGYMRQLAPRKKAEVRAVKLKKGYHAAITLAKKLGAKAR